MGETYRFETARDLFEAAREAARDAERISRQLAAIEARAESAGTGFSQRVRSTSDPDRMGRVVAALVDKADALERRQDEDYRLIDAACTVLYGEDNCGGLWALCGWRADAIYHHYLGLMTWAQVGELMGYSEQHVWRESMAALETADGWGYALTVDGMGGAT